MRTRGHVALTIFVDLDRHVVEIHSPLDGDKLVEIPIPYAEQGRTVGGGFPIVFTPWRFAHTRPEAGTRQPTEGP